MKTFQQFQEDLSRNTIPLDAEGQRNLRNSLAPGVRVPPNSRFRLVPLTAAEIEQVGKPVKSNSGTRVGRVAPPKPNPSWLDRALDILSRSSGNLVF